jgi:hypothetical protein
MIRVNLLLTFKKHYSNINTACMVVVASPFSSSLSFLLMIGTYPLDVPRGLHSYPLQVAYQVVMLVAKVGDCHHNQCCLGFFGRCLL